MAVIVRGCGGCTAGIVVVPLVYPVLLAVAVIVPRAAFIRIVTWPLMSVVPLPVAAPLRLTVAPLTGVFPMLTVKVTYVGVFTVTLLALAVMVSMDCGTIVKPVVPLVYPLLLTVAVIVPRPALIKSVTWSLISVVPLPVAAPLSDTVVPLTGIPFEVTVNVT